MDIYVLYFDVIDFNIIMQLEWLYLNKGLWNSRIRCI